MFQYSSMTANRKDIRSKALDLLRFPLACVIVTIHVFAGASIVVRGISYSFSDYSLVTGMILFARSFLSGQSVPIYFFIAGYVFFLGINLDMSTYERKMHNRFKSLLIPYIAWNIMAIIMALLPYLPSFSAFFPGLVGRSPDYHIANILNMFWDARCGMFTTFSDSSMSDEILPIYPADVPLWFVRDLMIVGVTTPLLNIILKRFGKLLPIALGIIWFCLSGINLGHGTQLITAYFFFTLGAYLSFNKRDMITEFKRMRKSSFIIYPAVAALLFAYSYYGDCKEEVMSSGFIEWKSYVKNIAVLAGLPFAYNLAVLAIERWKIESSPTLASASFFIYAGHMIFYPFIEKLLIVIIKPASNLSSASVLILTVTICILALLGVYIAMRRFTPRVLGLFTGGRF